MQVPKISKNTRWYKAGKSAGKSKAETMNGFYLEDNICQYIQGYLDELIPAFKKHKTALLNNQLKRRR